MTAHRNNPKQGAQAPFQDPLSSQPLGTAKPFDEEEFNREVSKTSGWSEVKDPVAEIRRMRGDPDYTGFNKMLNALKSVMEYVYVDCAGCKRCCLGPEEVSKIEAAIAEAEAV